LERKIRFPGIFPSSDAAGIFAADIERRRQDWPWSSRRKRENGFVCRVF
jgi:hypothetical protein